MALPAPLVVIHSWRKFNSYLCPTLKLKVSRFSHPSLRRQTGLNYLLHFLYCFLNILNSALAKDRLMHKSQLAIDTKVNPVLGPHSANLVVGTGVSGKGQRTRSNSDASASSSLSTSTSASMTSLAVPKSLHVPSPQSRSQSPSSPQDETVRVSSEYVLAMHDYDHKSNTTCLSFRAGQVIHVLNRDPSGWWDGELEGRRGWFPSNYVNTDYGRSAAQVARVSIGSDPHHPCV